LLVALAVAAALPGCATIVGGHKDQLVHFESEPPGAAVVVDGDSRGVTPTDVPLSRRQEHRVELDLPDCPPYVTTLKPGCNPWVLGNVFFGGLIGMAVDISTGANTTLYPKTVKANLGQTPPGSPVEGGAPPGSVQPASYTPPQ
jgi:hypothetical protein